MLSALDGAGAALQGAHAAAAATLKAQRAALDEALDEQARGNASAAVAEGLRAARAAVDEAAAARVAEFAAARAKLDAQQAALVRVGVGVKVRVRVRALTLTLTVTLTLSRRRCSRRSARRGSCETSSMRP